MNELIQAFLLGNAAILTNVCILPLYPGLMAYMAGNIDNPRHKTAGKWLGVFVLAGVLTLLLIIGFILYQFQKSSQDILPILLPLVYGIIIVLGVLMILGINPFTRLATVQTPALQNPYIGAYTYGLLLGPMTLPCTGALLFSTFLLGVGSIGSLVDSIAYFLAFGLGFGWPLVLLPFVAAPLQRRFTKWMTQNYKLLTRVSGVLLVAIGLFSFLVDFTTLIL